ncbi:MAG: sulfatase-like hydrolase/transferase [Reichenbachiella sp.]
MFLRVVKRALDKETVLCILIGLLIVSSGCKNRLTQDRQNKKPPNVLILFSDQHNKKVVGFEDHPDVKTPNLDKLAKEAFVFDRAYCTTGICAPARSSLMTGIYPRTLGVLSNSERTSVMDEVISLPKILGKNGYKTYAFGKRHTSAAVDQGWDEHKSHLCNESPNDNYVTWVTQQGFGKEFAKDWAAEFGRGASCSDEKDQKIPIADLGTRLSNLPKEYTMEAYTAQNTIEMIKKHKDSDDPFFCWSTFYRPHQPYTPIKEYLDMYDISSWGEGVASGSSIKKPESFYEAVESLPPMLQEQRNGGNKVWNMDKAFEDEQLWRNYIGSYYALVTEMDFHIGQIIDALEKSGMKDETIIIYTSDHGDFVGNHGMVEKAAAGHNVYEDILNIPLIIRYPGQTYGERKYELVSQVDVMPTILDILGLQLDKPKHPIQGKSLHKVMKYYQPLNRDYIVSESWSQAAVITDDYKLGMMLDPSDYKRKFDFRSFGDMFYDRSNDPLELNNGIEEKNYEDQIKKLRKYYNQFEATYSDLGKQEVINAHKNKALAKIQ